jgi:hypothetical protein
MGAHKIRRRVIGGPRQLPPWSWLAAEEVAMDPPYSLLPRRLHAGMSVVVAPRYVRGISTFLITSLDLKTQTVSPASSQAVVLFHYNPSNKLPFSISTA